MKEITLYPQHFHFKCDECSKKYKMQVTGLNLEWGPRPICNICGKAMSLSGMMLSDYAPYWWNKSSHQAPMFHFGEEETVLCQT